MPSSFLLFVFDSCSIPSKVLFSNPSLEKSLRAFLNLFLSKSQCGLPTIWKELIHKIIAGILAETIIILQIGFQFPQMLPRKAFMQKADNWPRTMNIAFLLTLIVLTGSGEISAKYIGDRLEAAPTDKPRAKRKNDINKKFIERAHRIVELVNKAAIQRKMT